MSLRVKCISLKTVANKHTSSHNVWMFLESAYVRSGYCTKFRYISKFRYFGKRVNNNTKSHIFGFITYITHIYRNRWVANRNFHNKLRKISWLYCENVQSKIAAKLCSVHSGSMRRQRISYMASNVLLHHTLAFNVNTIVRAKQEHTVTVIHYNHDKWADLLGRDFVFCYWLFVGCL